MPTVRKLTLEEVQQQQQRNKGVRKRVEEEYDAFLREYDLGDYGVAELGNDEKRMTVRNRLKAAALRRSVGLEFRRTRGSVIRFQVVPQPAPKAAKQAKAATTRAVSKRTSTSTDSGQKRGPGRPPKARK